MREGLAVMPDSPEDASPEEYRDILIEAGLCVVEVVIESFAKNARFEQQMCCSIRPRSQVWLSRTVPEEDAFSKSFDDWVC